jgi:hypothetical protein
VAVVVSIARGHDASYPFKTTGAAEGPLITGRCRAGYYLSAVENHLARSTTRGRRHGSAW